MDTNSPPQCCSRDTQGEVERSDGMKGRLRVIGSFVGHSELTDDGCCRSGCLSDFSVLEWCSRAQFS